MCWVLLAQNRVSFYCFVYSVVNILVLKARSLSKNQASTMKNHSQRKYVRYVLAFEGSGLTFK